MKKGWFTLVLSLILAAALVCSPVLASAAELGAEIDGAKVVFENPGLTSGDNHNWEGYDPSLVTSTDGEMTVTAAAGLPGMYYRPNSPYGVHGAFGEGGLAMKLKLNFQETAAGDWGLMLLIRNTGHLSWNATNAVSLYFCVDKVILYQAGNATPLAVLYKSLANAYYNVEFITDDVDGGKTNAYVLITDENGNLVRNDGDTGAYSMKVEGLDTASLPAAFISMYVNSAELASFSMKQGEWTYNKTSEEEVAPPVASTEYPSLEGVSKYNFEELGIANPDGLDKFWSPIGGNNYAVDTEKGHVSVTQSGTEGFYFGPCSPYGGALVTNVAVAMNLSLDFKAGANDFGYMLILKGDQPSPSWAISKGIVMMVYPNAVKLCKVENAALVDLAVCNVTLESGKNYNVEFIAVDNANGTTDAWLRITDDSGKLLTETAGSEVTLGVTGITGAAGEGWVTMFANGGVISGYRFGAGSFKSASAPVDPQPPVDSDPTGDIFGAVVALMTLSGGAVICMSRKRR